MGASRLLLVLALGAVGCGPDCQSSCQKLFATTGECQLRIPGEDPSRSLSTCIDGCEAALDVPGELGDYDPFEQNTSGASVELENEKQAAYWMDCVDATGCEDIDDGYCAPLLPNP